jgi:Ca2+-binding EF-hand superfamily protein
VQPSGSLAKKSAGRIAFLPRGCEKRPIPNLMKSIPLSLALAFVLSACATTKPDRFATADANKDGKLSAHEVNDYFVLEVFEARDKNKDGKITKAEWDSQISKQDSIEFDKRDTNKDGAVTLAEAQAYAFKKGTYTAAVKAADKNKDGVVTREEAKAYYASKE